MATLPGIEGLELGKSDPETDTSDLAHDNAIGMLDATYTTANNWAQYAATVLESKLTAINSALEAGPKGLDTFLTEVTAKINATEVLGTPSAITYTPPTDGSPTLTNPTDLAYTAPDAPDFTAPEYTAPTAPTFTAPTYTAPTAPTFIAPEYTAPDAPDFTAPEYTAPDAPEYEAVAYVAPDNFTLLDVVFTPPADVVFDEAEYSAPTLGELTTIPEPTQYTAGDAPSTDITFTNSAFTDPLLTKLSEKLTADLTGVHTGLGAAEAGLFDREIARQNAIRLKAYNEATTSFSSRGWDQPPGALLAKQTELNNESATKLADASAQIMAESARLAVDYNKTTLSSSAQVVDTLGRIFDSRINRDFEAAKNSVMLALEGFKAAIQVVVANAGLEGQYIGAVSAYNDATIKAYTSEVGAESARVSGIVDINKAKVSQYTSKIQGILAAMSGTVETNKARIEKYTGTIQGKVAEMSGKTEYNKALGSQFANDVQMILTKLQSESEVNKLLGSKFSNDVQMILTRLQSEGELNKLFESKFSNDVQMILTKLQSESEVNKLLGSKFSSDVQLILARLQGEGEMNKALSTVYELESKGELTRIIALGSSDAAQVDAYGNRVKSASLEMQAKAETEKAKATVGEINSRRTMALIELEKSVAASTLQLALQKYLGEMQLMEHAAAAQMQFIASALNGLSVHTSYGFSASANASENRNLARGDVSLSGSVSFEGATPPEWSELLAE